METDLATGTWTDPALAKVRFSTYATRWRESLAHLRPGTLNNVDSFLHCHILPAFGPWPIGRIEPADVRAFVADLVEKGLAPTTVGAVYRVFGRILSTAETDGVIPRTPCRGIRLPRQTTSTEQCFLNPDEVRRLAEAIDPRYRVLIYTAAYTGMRWGELAGLRIPRLDLLRGTIDITEALTEVNGTVRTGSDQDGQVPDGVHSPVPGRAFGRAPGHVPVEGRLRLHVAQGWTASAQLLPPPLQARSRASGATDETSVPRSPPHVCGAAHRPGGASQGDPGAPRPLDHPAHLRPIRAPVAHARRAPARGPRRHVAGGPDCREAGNGESGRAAELVGQTELGLDLRTDWRTPCGEKLTSFGPTAAHLERMDSSQRTGGDQLP